MKKRRYSGWVILAILVILAVAGWSWRGAALAKNQPAQAAATTPAATAVSAAAQDDTSTLDVTATGNLQTGQSINLAWQAEGKVAKVLVVKGDTVVKGQILAQLDITSNVTWATTQANLLAAQQTLADLENVTVSQASARLALIKAQAAVTNAQFTLTALETPPSKTAIDDWKTLTLEDQAKATQAQTIYVAWIAYASLPNCPSSKGTGGGAGGGPGGGPGGGSGGGDPTTATCRSLSDADLAIQQVSAKARLSSANQTVQTDQAYLAYYENYMPDPTLLAKDKNTLDLAQEHLVLDQAAYDAVKNGPDPAKIAVAQAAITTLQAELDKQYLRAPFAGTVTTLNVKAGDVVSAGTAALRIDNLSTQTIALQVSEIDINRVQVGQTVELIFDALPDKQYNATVTNVGLVGTVSGGVSNFTVIAVLTDADSSIKSGMTAGATIVVQQ